MQTETVMRKVVSGLFILGTGKLPSRKGSIPDTKALRLVETKLFDSGMLRLFSQPDNQ
jgi:hypothetical protein